MMQIMYVKELQINKSNFKNSRFNPRPKICCVQVTGLLHPHISEYFFKVKFLPHVWPVRALLVLSDLHSMFLSIFLNLYNL
jgi:hypothetical protein